MAAVNGPGGFPTINQGARTLEGDSSKRALLRDGEVKNLVGLIIRRSPCANPAPATFSEVLARVTPDSGWRCGLS